MKFQVESVIRRRRCSACSRKCEKDSIVISSVGQKVVECHLDCFQAHYNQYLSTSILRCYLQSPHSEVFSQWLHDWNIQFTSNDHPVELPQYRKRLSFEARDGNRAWILCLSFLPPVEVLTQVARVNKELYEVTWLDELWNIYLEMFYPEAEAEGQTWRERFMTAFLNSCIGCGFALPPHDMYRCPTLLKPICRACRKTNPNFRKMTTQELSDTYGKQLSILPNNVEGLKGYGSHFVVYKFQIEQALQQQMEANKARLIEELSNARAPEACLQALIEHQPKPLLTFYLGTLGKSWFDLAIRYIACGTGTVKRILRKMRKQ